MLIKIREKIDFRNSLILIYLHHIVKGFITINIMSLIPIVDASYCFHKAVKLAKIRILAPVQIETFIANIKKE